MVAAVPAADEAKHFTDFRVRSTPAFYVGQAPRCKAMRFTVTAPLAENPKKTRVATRVRTQNPSSIPVKCYLEAQSTEQ